MLAVAATGGTRWEWAFILVLGVAMIVYTEEGGVRATVWTDVVQLFVYLAGALVCLVAVVRLLPGGAFEALAAAQAAGKTRLLDFSFDLHQPYTFWAGLIGGAFLTLSAFNAFFFGMVNGRGWIAIALVVFASWRPGKALLGALLFGAFDAFQIRLQQIVGGAVPYQLFLMLPYLLSILALVLVARRAAYPLALMRPYLKGQR